MVGALLSMTIQDRPMCHHIENCALYFIYGVYDGFGEISHLYLH